MYQQYKQGDTYYGYDPSNNQGIAFSNPQDFNKYFPTFDQNAPAPTFDVSKLMASPNQAITLPPSIDQLENEYKNLLSPSTDETSAQTDLNNLISSTRSGYTNIDNKPIPMEFITGQQRALEQRSADLALPLQQRLAMAQAKRQAALEASRFALERADRRMTQAKQEQQSNPLSQGYPFYKYPGSIQAFDAKTNKPITYEQYKAMGGVGQPGTDKWGDIYEVGATPTTADKILSVTDAARLGVPYGTTQTQAFSLNKVPTTRLARTSSGTRTTKPTTGSAYNEIVNTWRTDGYIQGNGTISSIDYKRAKEYWISLGLSASSFDTQFNDFIDKSGRNWQKDYGYGIN